MQTLLEEIKNCKDIPLVFENGQHDYIGKIATSASALSEEYLLLTQDKDQLCFILSIDKAKKYPLFINSINEAIELYHRYITPYPYQNVSLLQVVLTHMKKNRYVNKWDNIDLFYVGGIDSIRDFENRIVCSPEFRQPAYRQSTAFFVQKTEPAISSYKTTFSDSHIIFMFIEISSDCYLTFMLANYSGDCPVDVLMIRDDFEAMSIEEINDKIQSPIPEEDKKIFQGIKGIMNQKEKFVEFVKNNV
jgi:hypothetical protein